MFESLSDFFESGWNSVKTAASGAVDSWDKSVADLKAKATEFMNLFARLKAVQAQPGLTAAEKSAVDKILSRGETVKKTVSTLTRGIDGIASVLPSGLLAGAARGGALGILPLVPVAAIAAAIAAMTAWTSDAIVELERLELAEKVRQDGGNPAAVFQSASKINYWVAGGALLATIGLVYMIGRAGGKK